MRCRLRTLLILMAIAMPAFACPICVFGPLRFSDWLREYDVVVIARLVTEIRQNSPRPITAEYEVTHVLKAVGVDVREGDRIIAP